MQSKPLEIEREIDTDKIKYVSTKTHQIENVVLDYKNKKFFAFMKHINIVIMKDN